MNEQHPANVNISAYRKYLNPLVNGVIKNITVEYDEGTDEIYCGLIIEVNGRTLRLVALSDEEGNGPGFLSFN